MRTCLLPAIALLLVSGGAALAQPRSGAASSGQAARQQPLSTEDKRFLDYAAQDNQAEIQLCLVAEKQASSPAVKAFARLMVDDHVDVESRLASLVNGLNVSVPNDNGKDGNETMAKLEPLHGAEFDRAFMKAQIEDHGKDIEKFDKETKATQNDGVRRFASETIDILKQHHDLAKAVQAASTK